MSLAPVPQPGSDLPAWQVIVIALFFLLVVGPAYRWFMRNGKRF